MEREKADYYKTVITTSAEIFFYDVVEYLYEHMSVEMAEASATELHELALSLNQLYHRGTIETKLTKRDNHYRYILFKRTPRAQVKIIYYADQLTKTIYLTDFFPAEKDPKKLLRNK